MTEQEAPAFNILRVYLKDASLEQPNSPQILTHSEQPEIGIQLGVGVQNVAEDQVEVVVQATVTAQIEDKTLFLVEAKQAGLFQVSNIPDEQMGTLVGIACPQIIYPYLRGNVADLVQRAGFPPVHLTEVNFSAIYQQQLAQQAGAESAN
jgi:preprotein translocase subunit SecB